MPRSYSEQFMLDINRLDSDIVGVKLGKACIQANLPAIHIAKVLGVSRMTIHSWFRGKPLRDKNVKKVKQLLDQIETAMSQGTLPALTMNQAKEYIQSINSLPTQ